MSTKNRNDIQNGNIIVVAGRYKAVYGTDNDCQFGSCGAEQVSYFFFRYLFIISKQEDSYKVYTQKRHARKVLYWIQMIQLYPWDVSS